MAVVWLEGWEKQGIANFGVANLGVGNTQIDQLGQSILKDWATWSPGGNGGTFGLTVGRQGGTSKAIIFYSLGAGQSILTRNLPSTYSRLIVGFAINTNYGNNCVFTFLNSGTIQGQVYVDTLGHLNVSRNGSILFTSTQTLPQFTWHYIEMDMTFSPTAGHFQLWLDGVSLTNSNNSQNTSSSTAINQCRIENYSNTQALWDDMYLFDPNTGATNIAARGDSIVQTLFPNGDTAQKNFTNPNYAIGWYARQVSNTASASGNFMLLVPVTPEVGCTMNSVALVPQSTLVSAKFKGVVYSDSSGNPGSLLSSGTEVVGTTSNQILTLPLVTPQALVGGTQYWIGIIYDTTFTILISETTLNRGQFKANTYTLGAPAGPLSGMTTGQTTYGMWANCGTLASNYACLDQTPGAIVGGNTTLVDFVQSVNIAAGDEDLYTMSDLTGTASSIACVQLSALLSKDVAGTRTGDLRLKSTNDSAGSASNFALATSPSVFFTTFDTDPNGNITWTQSAVNAMTAGVKVNT